MMREIHAVCRDIRAAGTHIYNHFFDIYHAIITYFRDWSVCVCPPRHFESPVACEPSPAKISQRNIQRQTVDPRLENKLITDRAVYESFSDSLSRINAESENIYNQRILSIVLSLLLPANQRRLFLLDQSEIEDSNLNEIGDVYHLTCVPTEFCFSKQRTGVWLQLLGKNEHGYLVVAQREKDIQWFPERVNLAYRTKDFVLAKDKNSVRRNEKLHGRGEIAGTEHLYTQSTMTDADFNNITNLLRIHRNQDPHRKGIIRSLARLPDGHTIMLYSISYRQAQ
ncbi:hypothetical protein GCM10023116_06780 [Kistimonas scapharcae]|uniref:Uncharacterized protein n=1 Tax=Kistimonas scapharcae TaxID=1036133 RepID=A0ABP8UYJ5_9GAMM